MSISGKECVSALSPVSGGVMFELAVDVTVGHCVLAMICVPPQSRSAVSGHAAPQHIRVCLTQLVSDILDGRHQVPA